MTKTKDFVSAIPQAASLRSVARESQKGVTSVTSQDISVKNEMLNSSDSDDSGDSGSLQIFTTIDDLPTNKVVNIE
jgi:hypothetical protein